jgi:hypothetical protein
MGCGASTANAAAAAPGASGVVERGTTGDEAQLLACWSAIAGGAERVLSSEQLRLVFEQLGRRMSDQAFDVAFRRIDVNSSGTVEFGEFVVFYREQSVEEQKQIRALKVEAELRRRLATGQLSPEQEQAVRDRLGVAVDGLAVDAAAPSSGKPPAPEQLAQHAEPTNDGANEAGESAAPAPAVPPAPPAPQRRPRPRNMEGRCRPAGGGTSGVRAGGDRGERHSARRLTFCCCGLPRPQRGLRRQRTTGSRGTPTATPGSSYRWLAALDDGGAGGQIRRGGGLPCLE